MFYALCYSLKNVFMIEEISVGFQCVLTAMSTMGQLYRVDKIYSWKISDYPEYPEKMTDLPPFTDILHRIMLYRLHLAWSLIIYGDTMYHILKIFYCQIYTAGLNTRCATSIKVSPDTIQSGQWHLPRMSDFILGGHSLYTGTLMFTVD